MRVIIGEHLSARSDAITADRHRLTEDEIMQERIWKFRVSDGETDCASYLEKRATEMAAALNCQLVATNQVQVAHGTKTRMVAGVALLAGENLVSRKGGRRPGGVNCRPIVKYGKQMES